MSNNKAPPSQPDGREVEEGTFCLVESKFTVENTTVAGLPKEQRESRVSMHTENWSLVVSKTFNYLPTSGPMCKIERRMLYTEDRNHSLLLSGDADRSCSMFGRDFVVGGEDAVDRGDVADSAPSRAASAL
jgi:hypothetical protein